MYVILASLFAIIFLFFWQTIYTVLSSYTSTAKKHSNIFIGNMWYVVLLIINALICIFIYLYYNYKAGSPGKAGIDGNKGFPGENGDICYIKDTISCKINNNK